MKKCLENGLRKHAERIPINHQHVIHVLKNGATRIFRLINGFESYTFWINNRNNDNTFKFLNFIKLNFF